MSENEIKQMLDTLAEYQAQRDVAMMDKQRLLEAIYTPEIKAAMAEVEAEFAGKTEAVAENIAALEAEIKQAVLEYGASVKGALYHAVFAKGRISWDTKSLDGYAAAHPELLTFRKEGEPSVSLRTTKGN